MKKRIEILLWTIVCLMIVAIVVAYPDSAISCAKQGFNIVVSGKILEFAITLPLVLIKEICVLFLFTIPQEMCNFILDTISEISANLEIWGKIMVGFAVIYSALLICVFLVCKLIPEKTQISHTDS